MTTTSSSFARARAPRAYALILVMAMVGALSLGGAVAFAHVGKALVDEPAVQRRAQLLWLARSAALQARAGERTFTIAGERVVVRTTVDGATATRGTAVATVTTAGGEWIERYRAR